MKRSLKSGLALNLDSSVIQDNVPVLIAPGLYMGSIHCSFNEVGMKSAGVTHIINTSGTPATFPQSFHYLSISIRDKNYSNLLSCIPACNIFIETGLESGGSVLVHCTGGRSRSAAILTAYLMSSKRIGFDEAFSSVKLARSLAACNAGFEEQLRAYGECEHDVHRAHQMLLQKHMRQLTEMRNKEKITPVRRLAATTISNPLNMELLRPGSEQPNVTIPPLRGLDMQYVCRKCQWPLFVASSIVLHTAKDNMRASGRKRDSELQGEVQELGSEISTFGDTQNNLEKSEPTVLRTKSDMVNSAAATLKSKERKPDLAEIKSPTSSSGTNTVLVTSPLTSNAANGSVYAFSAQSLQSVVPTNAREANKGVGRGHDAASTLASSNSIAAPPVTRRHGGSNGAADKSFDFGINNGAEASTEKGESTDDPSAAIQDLSIDPVVLSELAGKSKTEKATANMLNCEGQDRKLKQEHVSSMLETPAREKIDAKLFRNSLIVPRTPPMKWRPEETRSWIGRMKELECGFQRKDNAQHKPSVIAARDQEVAQKIVQSKCK